MPPVPHVPPVIVTVLVGGGFAFETMCLLRTLSDDASFVYLCTETGGTPGQDGLPPGESVAVARFATVTRPSRLQSLRAFRDTFRATRRVLRERQVAAVVVVGCSHAVPMFLAARLHRRPTVYVESITRTTRLSNTGRLVLSMRLASRFLVQWPALRTRHRGAELGTIL